MSNMILITPAPDASFVDRAQYIGFQGKKELDYVYFGHTVRVGDYDVVGRVNVGASVMTRIITGPAQLYSILENLLQQPEDALKLRADFYESWQALVGLTGQKGFITMLLLCVDRRVRLFTFHSHENLEVLEFTEPTLYNAGMILTEAVIAQQMGEEHQRKLTRLSRSFNAEDADGIDLDDFS